MGQLSAYDGAREPSAMFALLEDEVAPRSGTVFGGG
jgi:hypothetical protein